MQLKDSEKQYLVTKYGAGFCHCVTDRAEQITAAMLLDYCKHRGFREFHPMTEDNCGKRYSYYLFQRTETDHLSGKTKQVNVVATFFDFEKFPKATAEGIVDSLKRIAWNDNKTADEIAEEVLTLGIKSQLEQHPQ